MAGQNKLDEAVVAEKDTGFRLKLKEEHLEFIQMRRIEFIILNQ